MQEEQQKKGIKLLEHLVLQQIATHNVLMGQEALARCLAEPRYADPLRLERYGAHFFSQNDEDGILREIFRRIGTRNRTFLEFGVENGLENNSLLLLMEGWRGVWLEGANRHIQTMRDKFAPWLQDGRLRLRETFITAENIDKHIRDMELPEDLDLLSIDIDGNDYYVFEAIQRIRPRVVVIEYNGLLPPPIDAVVPYSPTFIWQGNDYYGASLQALTRLAEEKGYRLVGTNITGVNAFFVRQDEVGERFAQPATAAHLYNPMRYHLTFAGTFRTGNPNQSMGPWILR